MADRVALGKLKDLLPDPPTEGELAAAKEAQDRANKSDPTRKKPAPRTITVPLASEEF